MDRSPTVAPAIPGYTVGERLGAGGSGHVWAAVRDADGLEVAVKVVPLGAGDDGQAEAAAREVAVLGRVAVEGLVGFHEALALPDDPPGVAVVLDRVHGRSLASVVAARGHLTPGESVTVLAPVCRALAGLHAVGVVHGDVSPGNVLVERTGRPLLADLGVARIAGDADVEVWGTDGFLAPEVLAGDAPGPAADVYAAAALAWWAVTGEPPGYPALRPPLAELAPQLPTTWRDLTEQALAGDPARRPTAVQLALGYFDAVPCEPLRLVVPGDETFLLTHRIRSAGDAPPPEPREPAVRRWRLPRPRPRGWRLPRVQPLMGALVGALAVLVATGGIGLVGTAGADGQGPVRTAPSVAGPPPSSPTDADATPLTDRRAPSRDALGLVRALADERAAAMESGEPAAFDQLDAPGSEARSADRAAAAEARESGRRYADVRLTAVSGRLVRVTASEADVDAVVDTAAYRLVGPDGEQRVAAVQGTPVRLALAWSHGRWRVVSVRPVPAG